jgi:hypothetical protein
VGKARIKELLTISAGNRLAPPVLNIDSNNILTATAWIDSISIYLALKDRYYRQESIKTTVVEVNKLAWWQIALCWAGAISVFIIIIIIIVKVWKL